MEFRNLTPFPHLLFESTDQQRTEFGVAVLRGTFEIGTNELLISEVQEEILMQDEFYGEENVSSIRYESSLAPLKPSTDIHINANAYAPSGKPEKRWNVKVEVGELIKEIHVTGPRSYDKRATGWELSEPIEVIEVPMLYENAFGGLFEKEGEIVTQPRNFVGVGFVDESCGKESHSAPQIVSLEDLDPKFGESTKVEGIGVVSPTWAPRVNLAGSYDDEWLENTWPHLPANFQFEFWNSAHPDLVCPEYLTGKESVKLHHLSPQGLIAFTLPGYEMHLLCRMEDGNMIKSPLNLDTVHIDVHVGKVYLTWRAIYPSVAAMRVLEARINVPKNG